jgi:FKBP-type peptidyl-prolyl cis-trans isomerase FklB
MTRVCCVIMVLISLSVRGAPLDFKFDPNVRRPVEDPVTVTDPFLVENAKREGVETLPSGVQIQRIEEGYGRMPSLEDMVVIDYVGWLPDGTVFDSTIRRGETASFRVAGVVPGFAEGLMHMRMGGKARVYIPGHLGYGKKGSGDIIPPDATLIFEITIHEVKEPLPFSE